VKILFSEGSSTSARQSLYAVGRLGHVIDVCDPQRIALCRFSHQVRRWRRGPSFGRQPMEYLRFVIDALGRRRYDVLFPTHDQAYLFARYRDDLRERVGLAVPPFEAIRQVQHKVAFARLLEQLDIPQPQTEIVDSLAALDADRPFPCWVKLGLGTAGRNVWRVEDRPALRRVAEKLRAAGWAERPGEILVQQPAQGDFCVAQVVFQHGRLVAAHTYASRAVGAGGAPCARISVHHPRAIDHLARLGSHLVWHGALHAEFFHDPAAGTVSFIEANPRIGETVNATLSGVNLCEYLLRVSLDETISPAAPPRTGVQTHALITSILGIAERRQGRRAVRRDLVQWWRGQGLYRDSQDELTRPADDWPSLIPALGVVVQVLARPSRARKLIRGAVDHYALSDATARVIDAAQKTPPRTGLIPFAR
jgi:predicted ATP-grasp superfamily ATP-dependent carboligase